MGVFDYLRCEYPIDAPSTVKEWQTKDTDAQYLELYKIDKDGFLWHEYRQYKWEPDETKDGISKYVGAMKTILKEWRRQDGFTGEIVFYGHEEIDGKDDYNKWWEYSAYFKNGRLEIINRLNPPEAKL